MNDEEKAKLEAELDQARAQNDALNKRTVQLGGFQNEAATLRDRVRVLEEALESAKQDARSARRLADEATAQAASISSREQADSAKVAAATALAQALRTLIG